MSKYLDDPNYPSISAAPVKNPTLKMFADLLRSGRDFGNNAQIPDWMPLIGDQGVGDLLLGGSPEELEQISYGNMPFTSFDDRAGTGSLIPNLKSNRRESFGDVAMLGADLVPGVGPLIKATKGLPVGLSTKDVKSDLLNELKKGYYDDGQTFRRVGAQKDSGAPRGLQQNNGGDWPTDQDLAGVRGLIEDPSVRGGRGRELRDNPELEASKQEVKRLIDNPDENPSVQIAQQIDPNFNVDFMKTMPPSSMLKQSPIAATFRQMVSESGIEPALKSEIFSRYLRQYPDVVRKSDATNYDELNEAAYGALARETDDQLDAMLANDVKLSFHKNGEGNYNTSEEMLMDALLNKHLYTFQGGDPHTYLNKYDPELGINTNEKFRAVHDFFGHGPTGASFGPKGEELAYGSHTNLYSPLAKMAAATETRGQNSFVNYSGLNADLMSKMNDLRFKKNEAIRFGATPEELAAIDAKLRELGGQWEYSPQTDFLLPPEFLDVNYGGGMPKYLRSHIQPKDGMSAPGFHWSKKDGLSQTDPNFYGTGIKGAEGARRSSDGWENRTYFYNHPSMKEDGLGPHQYEADLTDIYDGARDPLRLNANAVATNKDLKTGLYDREKTTNLFESAVKDAGYKGYKVDNISALFYPQILRKR